MNELLECIRGLKNSEIQKTIDKRLNEFQALGKKPSKEIFKELCFCILTANFNAERGIKIQKQVGNGFVNLSEEELAKKLKKLGHRYPNARANYILKDREYVESIKKILKSFKTDKEARDWLVQHIKGLGFKEASHFLRNIGRKHCAIIDFHIVDLLAKHKLVKKPKTMTRKRYIEIEKTLEKIAKKIDLDLAALDLYLWYLETGKVLK